jgi:hypothetical protein
MHIDFTGCPWWCFVCIDFFTLTWSIYFLVFTFDSLANRKYRRAKLEQEVREAEAAAKRAEADLELSNLRLKLIQQPQNNHAGVN